MTDRMREWTSDLITAVAVTLTVCGCAVSKTLADSPPAQTTVAGAAAWRTTYENDLAYVRDTLSSNYIYARYPGGSTWKAAFDPASARAGAAAKDVTSEAAYRAALSQLLSSFHDPH